MRNTTSLEEEAIVHVREGVQKDRERALFRDRLERTKAQEDRYTEQELDWQRNTGSILCRRMYYILMIPLWIMSLGIFFIVHLIIKNTYGKSTYPVIFVVFTLLSAGLYIPIHFLYKSGFGDRG